MTHFIRGKAICPCVCLTCDGWPEIIQRVKVTMLLLNKQNDECLDPTNVSDR